MSIPQTSFLRRTLIIDAVMTGATAVLLITSGGMLASLLELPVTLLRYAGAILVPFVIFVVYVARQADPPRAGVVSIILLNLAWILASFWLVLGDQVRPNGLGNAFIIVQALAVGLFAELQYVGLRRAEGQRRVALGG